MNALEASGDSELDNAARAHLSRRPAAGRPLPDATSICALTVPETEPPFDDVPLAPGPDWARPARAAVKPPPAQPPLVQPHTTPAQPTTQPPSNCGAWPSKFAQVLAETLAGSRPPAQIAPWTTEQARKKIGQLGPLLSASHRPRVRRVLVTSPASGVLEMTVIVALGPRIRALAVRLERADPASYGTRGRPGVADRPGRPVRAAATPSVVVARPPRAGSPAPHEHLDETALWRCTAVEAA
jgi:Family of unknown function (DUF6459)